VKLGRDTEAYVDEANGLVLKVRDGRVLQLDYIASAKDKSICPAYYDRPEEFAQEIFRYADKAGAAKNPNHGGWSSYFHDIQSKVCGP
jgi:hypothetical protein